jgi:hypothetical protein
LGDTARALTALERAAQGHESFFTVQPLGAAVFDPVRSSARFQALLRATALQ